MTANKNSLSDLEKGKGICLFLSSDHGQSQFVVKAKL